MCGPNPLYIFLGFAVFFIGIIVLNIWQEKKRRQALMYAAQNIGFVFTVKPTENIISELSDFGLFQRGYSRKVSNVMKGSCDGVPWIIFDYRYTTGGGKHSHTYVQTVAYARLREGNLPRFSLTPEHIFHKIGDIFGYKDVDFEQYPEFSKKYFLRGHDQTRIREVFTPQALAFFEQQNRQETIEAEDNRIIIYIVCKRVSPENLQPFIAEMSSIARLFMR